MRTISTALAASAVSVLTVGMAAPTALAQDADTNITSFGFTVSPKTVKAGGQVNLTATDCEHQARASSGVFNAVPLGMAGDPMQSASVTVDWDAKPGAEYTVTFTCGPETGRTTFKIADTSSTSRPRPSPSATTARPSAKPSATSPTSVRPTASASSPAAGAVKPVRPARGGLGGSQTGDPVLLASGTAVSSAAVLGGAVLLRRRRSVE
ncbi:hypothetical protein AB0M28_33885 [Streptomyces sp. NPDC051940]|uniref:hypothetical protein n=1 Tax=Streptomyces sp. NPDC051940 TaxID=3155675 RepID=UPI0034198A41